MTETHEHDTIIEALSIVDRALGEMLHREELVSTDEVSNLLLDVRTLLTTEDSALAQTEHQGHRAAASSSSNDASMRSTRRSGSCTAPASECTPRWQVPS